MLCLKAHPLQKHVHHMQHKAKRSASKALMLPCAQRYAFCYCLPLLAVGGKPIVCLGRIPLLLHMSGLSYIIEKKKLEANHRKPQYL